MTDKFQFLFDLKGSATLEWQVQKCREDSILFYSMPTGSVEDIKIFEKRIQNTNFKYCIVNCAKKSFKNEKIISLGADEFKDLQISLLESFYPLNSEVKYMGVTGTNGKTTTVDLVRQLAIQNNNSVMTFGTLGVYKNKDLIENFNLTTPSIVDIYKTINSHQSDVELIVFELSSHALVQNRLGNIAFDVIGWTNFSQDHLDYHETMNEYFRAKCLISEKTKSTGKIFLTDDLEPHLSKIDFQYKKSLKYAVGANPFFKVQYNQTNLNLALSMLSTLFESMKFTVDQLESPPGRFEITKYQNSFIIIDYAHTPDALEAICSEVAKTFAEYELIVLFGCGGDRDKSKRALMGKAASSFAGEVIVTNDNPRTEDPKAIADDILVGVDSPFTVELDRRNAIKLGIQKLEKHVLIIAGKGHENYIDIAGKKNYFSDSETVSEIMYND